MSKKTNSPYPTQPQPQQQPYPMQPPMQNPMNMQPATNPYYGVSGMPGMPGMPPPPPSYDQAMHHPIAPPNYIPQPMQQAPMNYPYYQQPHPYHQQPQALYAQQAQPKTTYVVHNAFDAGARFDSTSQARIPPPPPGVAPNMAQMAHAGGHDVVAGQRPDKWFTGGSDGGAVLW